MNKSTNIFKLAAIGGFVAIAVMIIISGMLLILGYDPLELQEKYFAGYQPLPLNDLLKLITIFKVSLIFDCFLIVGQITAWLGLSLLMYRKYGWITIAALAIGLCGPALDFVQNSMEWALVRSIELNVTVQPAWFFSWTAVTQGSYLFTFAGAFISGLMLFGKALINKLFSLVGSILVLLAAVGLYLAGLGMLSYLWYLLWFLMSALLLLSESKTLSSEAGI